MNRNHWFLTAAFILVGFVAGLGCDQVDKIKQTTSEKLDNPDIKKEIEEAYIKVKETGASVPNSAIEWATEDIKKIGDWDYRVVSLVENTPEKIEEKLNEYGANRWEIFWIEKTGEQKIIYMKRTARSYLKHIPLKEILKVIPVEQEE